MSELSDLYQEVILDHNRQPRNYHKIEGDAPESRGLQPAVWRSAHRVCAARRWCHP